MLTQRHNYSQKWDWLTAFMPYGDRYKKHRAFMHRFTQPSALSNYIPMQTKEVHVMLKNILNNPSDYDRYVTKSVLEAI